MATFYHASDGLLSLCKTTCDTRAVQAVLYSSAGFDARRLVKKRMESKVERKTLTICLLTCGLAVCCCGCCGCCDTPDLTEEDLCHQLQQEYPDETAPLAYDFEI